MNIGDERYLKLTEDELYYLMSELSLVTSSEFKKRVNGIDNALGIQKSSIVKIHKLKNLFETL